MTKLWIELASARPSTVSAEKMFKLLPAAGNFYLWATLIEEMLLINPDNVGSRDDGIAVRTVDLESSSASQLLDNIKDEIKPFGWFVSGPPRHINKVVRPGK